MNETKRRGWIKNVIIIFLAVLLILTLFSNTILNYSLPEVAVQYPQYASIASRIRTTGTVAANQSYELTIPQTRIIASVEVRTGATVKKGDVIFRLEEGDSAEIDQAKQELDQLNIQLIQKQKQDPALSTGGDGDQIANLKKELNLLYADLKDEREALATKEQELAEIENRQLVFPGADQLANAKDVIATTEANIEVIEEEIARLQGKQGQIGGDGYYTPEEIEDLIAKAKENVKAKEDAYAYAQVVLEDKKNNQKKLDAELKAAEEALESAQADVKDQEDNRVDTVTVTDLMNKQTALSNLQIQLTQKQNVYSDKQLQVAQEAYNRAQADFNQNYTSGRDPEKDAALIQARDAAAAEYAAQTNAKNEILHLQQQIMTATREYMQAQQNYSQSSQQDVIHEALVAAEKRAQEKVEYLTEAKATEAELVKDMEAEVAEAKTAWENAKDEVTKTEGYRQYDALAENIKDLKAQKAAMESQKSEAEKLIEDASDSNLKALLAELAAKKTDITAQKKVIASTEREITDTNAAIEKAEKQLELDAKNDELDAQQYAIELKQIEANIASKEAEIARLEENRTDGTVVSPVAGVIESLSVSAGQEAKADTPIATITLSDMGYTMQCTVSAEQAAKVSVGDTAEIQWYGWGKAPTARVVAIKSDAASQGKNKTITLEVTGDITPGTSLTFTLGAKNTSYDCVVPNSAVREDANGKFVLIVTAKNTPLGNRYSARRVDVEVLASDETNSAISGAISGEYVITTSSTPISGGMNVRLAED